MSVVPSCCEISSSAISLPLDHSVPSYRLGRVVCSGHPLASILHAEGRDYQQANPIGKVMMEVLCGAPSPSSEIRIHMVRHT
jgi:hypothetical protein